MGHSFQLISILVQIFDSVVAIPLAARLHEGIVLSNRDKRTLLDKMLILLKSLFVKPLFYFVGDAYYCNKKMVNGLIKCGNNLVIRARTNAVAYEQPIDDGKIKRGRKRIYGKKIALKSLFDQLSGWTEDDSPVYGEKNTKIRYLVKDRLCHPVGKPSDSFWLNIQHAVAASS